MSMLHLLATNQNRNDEIPNIELAQQLARTNDTQTINELVEIFPTKTKISRTTASKFCMNWEP